MEAANQESKAHKDCIGDSPLHPVLHTSVMPVLQSLADSRYGLGSIPPGSPSSFREYWNYMLQNQTVAESVTTFYIKSTKALGTAFYMSTSHNNTSLHAATGLINRFDSFSCQNQTGDFVISQTQNPPLDFCSIIFR